VVDGETGRTTLTHAGGGWTAAGGGGDEAYCAVDVAADDDGLVYVLDGQRRRVQLFDAADLRHVRDLLDSLQAPRRLAVDTRTARLYVADDTGCVLVFDTI